MKDGTNSVNVEESMNNRLKWAIEALIEDCQFAGNRDMTSEQLAESFGPQTAYYLVELRDAFRENYPNPRLAWKLWVEALRRCPRISRERHGDSVLPVNGCDCGDCNPWRKANKLHDEYRLASGLPI